MKIGISGICGRMGKRIAALALKDGVAVGGALEIADAPDIGKGLNEIIEGADASVKVSSDLAEICADIDCFIEFTFPEPTLEHLQICKEKGKAMVIGTTALDADAEAKIKEASASIPIVFSPNMSIGVNLLFRLVREAARVLEEGFDMRIDETHHVHKKDSPSGTAKMIKRVMENVVDKDIPVEAFREGEVVGNHGIVFESENETLEIRHDAKSRDVFAAGAVKAAKFLADKKTGLYTMADVLDLGQ